VSSPPKTWLRRLERGVLPVDIKTLTDSASSGQWKDAKRNSRRESRLLDLGLLASERQSGICGSCQSETVGAVFDSTGVGAILSIGSLAACEHRA
jgi:hypothetical protein